MSWKTYVVNELLAYLQDKQLLCGFKDEERLVKICTSCFDEDDIHEAKTLLYKSANMADQMPSRRRDVKGEKSLQDIMKFLKETDTDLIPTFVAKDLRRLPPADVNDINIAKLLNDISTINSSLEDMKLKFEGSQITISDLRAEVMDLRHIITTSRSHEASNVNPSCDAGNMSQASFASAKFDTTVAAVSASDVVPCPARPVSNDPIPNNASTSSPKRTYATAASRLHQQPERQAKNAQLVPSTPKSKIDQEGFIVVERKRKKPNCRNQCGTALAGPNMLLRPAIPTTQLYVSRLMYNTTTEDVVEYIRVKTGNRLRVTRLDSRHNVNFASFVVRVPTEQLTTYMTEDFWPRSVVFRRFRGTLHDTIQQRSASQTQRAKQ